MISFLDDPSYTLCINNEVISNVDFASSQNAVIRSVPNSVDIPCTPLLGENKEKTKTHSSNRTYSHNLQPTPSSAMIDNLHDSDSSISSFEAQSIVNFNFTQNIHSFLPSPDKLHFEHNNNDNRNRNNITASYTQDNSKNITTKENNKNSSMMCYSTIINDNPWWKEQEPCKVPWWKEQEPCKDHYVVPSPLQQDETPFSTAERRDEWEEKTSSSVDHDQEDGNESSRLKHLSIIQEGLEGSSDGSGGENHCIPRGYNDDGHRFDSDNVGKDREKDDYDNDEGVDDDDEDDDSSSIISSSSSAVFELFEDVSVLTDESSVDEEDKEGFHYFIFEASEDASLLTEATKDDIEIDFHVMIFSLVESDMAEDRHHQQQEEVIGGRIMIDGDNKPKVSNASKDLALLDFFVGVCSEDGFSSKDSLRLAWRTRIIVNDWENLQKDHRRMYVRGESNLFALLSRKFQTYMMTTANAQLTNRIKTGW